MADECDAGAELADETWNPFVRESIVAKIALSPLDRAPAVATAGIIDHWVRKWQSGRCTAGDRRASRVACLDHELGELRSLLATWSTGTGVERSVSAAVALPAPTACNSAADSLSSPVDRHEPLDSVRIAGESGPARPHTHGVNLRIYSIDACSARPVAARRVCSEVVSAPST